MKFELGSPVKETVTGFTGVVVGRYDCLFANNRYEVQSKQLSDDGTMTDTKWLDEGRLANPNQATQ